MAAPVAHIYSAQKWLRTHPELDFGQFVAGAVFPDIRLLAPELAIFHQPIKPRTDFERGIANHLLLDQARLASPLQKDYEDRSRDFLQALKIYEDQILFTDIDDWKPILEAINDSAHYPAEIDPKILQRWTGLVTTYLEDPRAHAARFMAEFADQASVKVRLNYLDQFQVNHQLKDEILSFYKKFAG